MVLRDQAEIAKVDLEGPEDLEKLRVLFIRLEVCLPAVEQPEHVLDALVAEILAQDDGGLADVERGLAALRVLPEDLSEEPREADEEQPVAGDGPVPADELGVRLGLVPQVGLDGGGPDLGALHQEQTVEGGLPHFCGKMYFVALYATARKEKIFGIGFHCRFFTLSAVA